MQRFREPQLQTYNSLSHQVDEAFAGLPDMAVVIKELSRSMPNMGQRLARRAGVGVEPLEVVPFDPERHERSQISAHHSAAGEAMVIHRESEESHRFYLWREMDAALNYRSCQDMLTKAQAADVLMFVIALNLLSSEDQVLFFDDPIAQMSKSVPKKSSVLCFGQFYDREHTEKLLDALQSRELQAHFVLILDPKEITCDFEDNVELTAACSEGVINGETSLVFQNATLLRTQWHQVLLDYIEWLQNECGRRDIILHLQRTDMPFEDTLESLMQGYEENVLQSVTKLIRG